MHLTIERLLAVQDGNAGPEAAGHLARCERCRWELERLDAFSDSLIELPETGPGRDLWPVIERELDRVTVRRTRRRWLAVAAMAVLAAGVVVALRLVAEPTAQTALTATNDSSRAVRELISASRELEQLLGRPSLRTRVMNPRQAALVVALEDRIAEVDGVIGGGAEPVSAADELALWSQRVRLLAALVQVRGAPGPSPEVRNALYVEGS